MPSRPPVITALCLAGVAGALAGALTAPAATVTPLSVSARATKAVSVHLNEADAAVAVTAKPTVKPATPVVTRAATIERSSVDRGWPDDTSGDGCPSPVWPSSLNRGAPALGRRVLVIGDSRTRDSRTALVRGLTASGWTPTIRCWGDKRIDWGISQVRRAASRHELPGYVVVSLGINDIGWTPLDVATSRARTLLTLLGPRRHVLWLEEYSTRSPANFSGSHLDYAPRVAEFNGWLREWASSHRGLSIIPWARVVKAHDLLLWDGIHYTSNGYRYRAQAVVSGLNARLRRDRAHQR